MSTILDHIKHQREFHSERLRAHGQLIIREVEKLMAQLDQPLPVLNTAGVLHCVNGFSERFALICAYADTVYRLENEHPGA